MSIIFCLLLQKKEIMNVNRGISFSFENLLKWMILVNCAPFNLITDPDLCEGIYFTYLTGFWVVRNNIRISL